MSGTIRRLKAPFPAFGGKAKVARLVWSRGDYARLVDAFGTVIDEIVVWPPETAPQKPEQPASPR